MKFLTSVAFTFLLGLLSLNSFAQSKIIGEVVDETDKTKLQNATVILLQAKDSILVDFTRVGENGKFSLKNPDSLDYILLVTYPKFGAYFQQINKGSGDVNLGQIQLQSTANLIEEVLITGKIPVVIKGDTTEYDASSFVTEKNAKVEDLLKVLPGISVDASGKITAQGKTVEKVLVDGEEFFGDDPTLVTRNIRSDMVDKVQVYEKKSDQTERTGVDEGTRVQTINVKLKEDAKNGMFGKLEAGGGADKENGYYLGKAMFNKFNGAQKISVFGLGANDDQNINLSWEEEEKFGLGNGDNSVQVSGGFFFPGGNNLVNWDGRGYPQALAAGASYLNSWKDKKHKINLNYKYGQLQADKSETTNIKTPLQSSIMEQTRNNKTNTDGQVQRFNSRYDYAIDSLSILTLKVSGSHNKGDNNLINNGQSLINGVLESTEESKQITESTDKNISYDAAFTRKFKKEGRSISLRVAGNNSKNEGSMQLNSKAEFLSIDSLNLIDQRKILNGNANNIVGSITYTEPLSKRIVASLGYDYTKAENHSVNNAYNLGNSGEYDVLDERFSNDFNFNTTRNLAFLAFNYKNDKIQVNLTNNFRFDQMYQLNNYTNGELSRDYFTYNPSANVRYNISKSKMLNINYNFNNNLPSLFQIQPLRQNTDQLNEVLGNENLKPSKSSSINAFFHSFDMLNGKFTYGGLNISQGFNDIRQNQIILTGGKTLSVFENMDKPSFSGSLYSGFGFDLIRKHQIKTRLGVNGNMTNYYSYITDHSDPNQPNRPAELNENNNYSFNLSVGFERPVTKGIFFNWRFNPGWNFIETSANPQNNSNGFVFSSDLEYRAYLPAKFQFYGNMNFEYQAPTKAFSEKFQRIQFTPGISKKFLKNEGLIVDLYVRDLFNQNKGFNRSQFNNSIRQEEYNNISRYFMLKVTWEFTSMKGAGQ